MEETVDIVAIAARQYAEDIAKKEDAFIYQKLPEVDWEKLSIAIHKKPTLYETIKARIVSWRQRFNMVIEVLKGEHYCDSFW